MPEPREDDLFKESTMTFGEHLGELRKCLVKSVLGLLVGFIIGLAIGHRAVTFIQWPLKDALNNYYQQESEDRVNSKLEELKKGGRLLWTPEQVADLVKNQKYLVDELYVDPVQLMQELKRAYPKQFKDFIPPQPPDAGKKEPAKEPDKDPEKESGKEAGKEAGKGTGKETKPKTTPVKLVRLFVWHRSEDDQRLRSKGLGATEAFSVYVKVSLLVGALLAGPWIFYQLWLFVAAGLYPHERRYIHFFLPFSIGLFVFGAALAFFVVFKPVLGFLLTFNRAEMIDPELRINEWLRFVLLLPLGFGIGFQLPLVMLFLERIGLCTVKSYLAQWRIAIMVIVVVAGILMPPDPYSMIIMASALILLFFGGILLCKMLPRRTGPFGERRG
jgi:sec-independent protein translocase protein TatC